MRTLLGPLSCSARQLCEALILIVFMLCAAAPAYAHRLITASFNVESGGADIKTLAKRVESQKGVDIWGFSEVQGQAWAEALGTAVAKASDVMSRVVMGTTGGADRLAVVFNESKLEYVRHFELRSLVTQACGQKSARAPLVVELRHKEMSKRFWFMVNHLQRGDEAYRHCQAKTLNNWVKTNKVAMIAVGDYNFDWDIATNGSQRDKGFDLLTEAERYRWVRPSPPLVKTQCRYNSILDFMFVTARAKNWPASSKIVFADEADYCTAAKDKDSDHRPILGQFEIQ